MKKRFKLSVPAFLMPLIVLGSWLGGEWLAGNAIPIPRAHKIYLMTGLTAATTVLFFIILKKGFGYRLQEFIPVVILGGLLLAALATILFNMVLHNFN